MKKILLIATGGTIACGDLDEGRTPELSARRLIELLPAIPRDCSVTTLQPFSLDSTNMSPREWCAVARLIRGRYDEFDGFVITHGTDTLGFAAAALSCLIQNSPKPVVLTGSMLPPEAEGSDAPRNLAGALYCAADGRLSGILVVFAGEIIDGRCAVKIDSRAPRAFVSANRPILGTVDTDGVIMTDERPQSAAPCFFDRMDTRCAAVRLVPGTPPSVLDLAPEIRAAVIEGFGTGGLPDYGGGEYEKRLAALVNRGVYAIMTTQAVFGGSDLRLYEVGRSLAERLPIIDAGEMTSEYACMRAMWALAYSEDQKSFKRLFAER